MRKSNEQSIGEAINEMIDTYKLRNKINEVKLLHAWEQLMGEAIAKRTSKIKIKSRTLTLAVTSAPLREELFNSQEKIISLLNEALEGDFIDSVKIR